MQDTALDGAINATLETGRGICHMRLDLIYRPHNDTGRK